MALLGGHALTARGAGPWVYLWELLSVNARYSRDSSAGFSEVHPRGRNTLKISYIAIPAIIASDKTRGRQSPEVSAGPGQ